MSTQTMDPTLLGLIIDLKRFIPWLIQVVSKSVLLTGLHQRKFNEVFFQAVLLISEDYGKLLLKA